MVCGIGVRVLILVGVLVLLRCDRGWLMRSSANGSVKVGSSYGGVLVGVGCE